MTYLISPELCNDVIDLLKSTYCLDCPCMLLEHIDCRKCFIGDLIDELEDKSP